VDITFKSIPDEIGEVQAREWVAVLVERYYNQKINQIPEVIQATETAKLGIDGFRKANSLQAKFESDPVVKEPEPVEPVKE
jgi:hypothetical protein